MTGNKRRMPELPEVETVMRGLVPHLVGRRITAVRATVDRLRLPVQAEILQRFSLRQQVVSLRRRAKFIVVQFGNHSGLLLHLGMTGAFRICPRNEPLRTHDRVVWSLDDGTDWRLTDARRFGSVQICPHLPPGADPPQLAHLGPEPLSDEFSPQYLHALTRGRAGPVKNLIMDQRRVVGVGNIYANEALFRARISPLRAGRRLGKASCIRLVAAIKTVLLDAIEAGGTTISDFRKVDGTEGDFRVEMRVYGKAGEPCPRCADGKRIRRRVQSGRSSFFCTGCQH